MPDVSKLISHLDKFKRLSITELLKGHVTKHEFFTSEIPKSISDLHDVSNLMYLYGNPFGLRKALSNNEHRIGNETLFVTVMYKANIKQLNASLDSVLYIGSNGVRFGWKMNNFSQYRLLELLASNKGISLKNALSGNETHLKEISVSVYC